MYRNIEYDIPIPTVFLYCTTLPIDGHFIPKISIQGIKQQYTYLLGISSAYWIPTIPKKNYNYTSIKQNNISGNSVQD